MARADRNLALMRADLDHVWALLIIEAIADARTGPCVLTKRETSVLNAASHGMRRDDTALLLGVGPETVKEMLTRCRRKLRARNTTHAVALAIRQGLIP